MGFYKKVVSLVISALLFVVSVSITSQKNEYKTYKDISYGKGKYQKMNIYIPENACKREYNGAIVFVHGGSWSGGSKDRYDKKDDIDRYTKAGYVTASIDYTLLDADNIGSISVFDMLDDITLSIKKLKSFAQQKNVKVTRLALSGYSAGAHLSLLYCYSRPKDSAIKLVFTASRVGPSDFSAKVWDDVYTENTAYALTSILTAAQLEEKDIGTKKMKNLCNSISPVYYVKKGSVPSLLGYGGKDNTVPIGNYKSILSALKKAGAKYDMVFYPNSSHKLLEDSDCAKRYTQMFDLYCKNYFGY